MLDGCFSQYGYKVTIDTGFPLALLALSILRISGPFHMRSIVWPSKVRSDNHLAFRLIRCHRMIVY